MYTVQCLAADVRHFIMYKHVWDCVFAVDATADDAEENEKNGTPARKVIYTLG